jgi:hypothetical protein
MKILLAIAGVSLGAALISGAGPTPAVPSVTLVRIPNGGIQPEVAIDDRGVMHLLYFAGEPRAGNLYYVRSRDYGLTFSAPTKVNSQDGSVLATGTVRGGQLALGRNGRVHVTWYGSDTATPRGLTNPGSGHSSPPLLYSHSASDGAGFEPQRNLTRRTYGFDGGSVAADGQGNVYAVWHALAAGDPAGEDHRRLWVARSRDDGETFEDEQPAWGEPTGACACC